VVSRPKGRETLGTKQFGSYPYRFVPDNELFLVLSMPLISQKLSLFFTRFQKQNQILISLRLTFTAFLLLRRTIIYNSKIFN
jgi:hypothetical protein